MLGAFFTYRFLERIDGVELVHCRLVKNFYELEGLLADGFLVVGKKQSAELLMLEDVFGIILVFRHGKDLESITRLLL